MEIPISQGILVVVGYLLAFLTGLHILMERREPTATLAWVFTILALPYAGILAYLLFGRARLNRQIRRRRAGADALGPQLTANVPGHEAELTGNPASHNAVLATREANFLERLSSRIGCRWPTIGNLVELLDPNQAYAAMEEAIEAAEQTIHFQFYIIEPDDTGRRFRDLLIKKAKQGVRVRVLSDGVGSFGLDNYFMAPLLEAGAEWAEFLPVGRLSRHWHPNLRNHRKIVVIDGKLGFTGGVNIGDVYTGRKRKIGNWRDTHLSLRGPAVAHLQEIFAEDWHFATGQQPDESSWFPAIGPSGESMVHIIASGPDTETEPIQRIFFAAIATATERVLLTTPYFVPDQALRVALETAALRGVDVRLLLPSRSDAPLVLFAGRSYYDDLLKSGVRIFEYEGGILHAKSMVVDRTWGTVGSANMDIRSFRLNFEVNAAVYGSDFSDKLSRQFERDLEQTREVTLESLAKKRSHTLIMESLARVLSPVL